MPDVPSGVPEAPPWESLRETWRERLERLPFEPSQVAAAVLVVVVLVAVGLGSLVSRARGPKGPPVEASLPRADATTTTVLPGHGTDGEPGARADGEVVVHVAGAVVRPGLYRLGAGGRVADAVAAAGGVGGDADVDRINLAAPVADGERVYVPRRGEAVAEPPPAPGGAAGGAAVAAAKARPPAAPVNLNTATIEQLEGLPGIGPSIARAILDHRTRHGPFRSVDDLLDVPGIGEAKLASIRARVRT